MRIASTSVWLGATIAVLASCSSPVSNTPVDQDVVTVDASAKDVVTPADTVSPTDTVTQDAPPADVPVTTDVQSKDVPVSDLVTPDVVTADVVTADVVTADVVSPDVVTADVAVVDAPADAVAVDVPVDVPCPSGTLRCDGTCVDTSADLANCGACGNACGTGQTCAGGVCTVMCATGQTFCSSACVNLLSDGANCGSCANACASGQMCASGACVTTCAAGQTLCGAGGGSAGSCAALDTDTANCGACGRACPAGQTCTAGACGCVTGQTLCGAACVNTQSSSANCGACGRACATGQMCVAGACASTCASGQTLCGATSTNPGTCVNIQTDTANCGACARACATGQTCTTGACACTSGQTLCGAACVNTQTSSANCGACGRACATGQMCASGACATTCTSGQTLCGATSTSPGTCVNAQTDSANCGSCGRACATGQTCTAGACACPSGLSLCGAACVNQQTDNSHCGGCGVVCPGGQTCAAGRCTAITLTGTVFQVSGLSPRTCRILEHYGATGDDRGGIAVSSTQVFYTGDIATGRFSTTDLSGGVSTGGAFDAMFSDLATQQVYAFGNASGPFRGSLGGAAYTIDRMFPLNGATGAVGAAVTLSSPIAISDTYPGQIGYFSGAGRVVVSNNARLYDVTLPSGAVRDLGAFTTPTHTICESSGFWGVAEFFGGNLYIDYVQSGSAIVRQQVYPAGATAVIQSFTSLSDMCSFTVSPGTNRWYWHHEGGSQFGGSDESVGYCSMVPAYVFSTSSSATFIDACAQVGATRQLVSVDDSVGAAVSLGFTFPFYGTPYTTARPSSNGYMIFGSTTAAGSPDGNYYPTMALPDPGRPFPAIFVYNSDLVTRGTGVCTATIGAAPSRRFIYEGVDEGYCCSISGNFTFEAILNESDSSMDFIYQTVNFPTGDTHNNVVGVQNSGTFGTNYEYANGARLSTVVTGTRLHVAIAP